MSLRVAGSTGSLSNGTTSDPGWRQSDSTVIRTMRRCAVPDTTELQAADRLRFAEVLGEAPTTVIASHILRRGLGRAWVVGPLDRFAAAVVQFGFMPKEPQVFGTDAGALARILDVVPGWDCVECTPTMAQALGPLVEARTGRLVRYEEGLYFELRQAAEVIEHPRVRLLEPADVPAWQRAPDDLRQAGYEDEAALLDADSRQAPSTDEGRLVSIVQTCAIGRRYADLGAVTLEAWRRQGVCAAATSLVCRGLQARGFVPVWSTGEGNGASQAVARRVGFSRVGTTRYVIPARDLPA